MRMCPSSWHKLANLIKLQQQQDADSDMPMQENQEILAA